ncbi:MAG: MotA/TolQ/ExbB proton channel family protein [Clostridiales bacterium]|jgi:hypothetical protein|nr:MotA/TolQ/ExbB proton channel family protein [Clostridiales bacterium]
MFSISNIMNAQTPEGRIICWIIIASLGLYAALSVCVLVYYSGIKRRAIRLREGREMNASDGFFGRIQTAFDDLISKGQRDAGQTAILDNSVSGFIKTSEYIIHYLPSFATILGLMGTFWGLTGAIGKMDLSMGGLTEISAIIDGINAPIGDMSTAFYTSLVGIVASAAMNIFERATRLFAKSGEALDNARDYLNVEYLNARMGVMSTREKAATVENDPANIAWQDASARIAKALQSLNESINRMSEDVTQLESRGIIGLSNSIIALKKTYEMEHEDIESVNKSMKSYLTMLQELGRALEKNRDITAANEELLEQMAVTYRMLAVEHNLLTQTLTER